MYEADPFAAWKAVEARQAKAAAKRIEQAEQAESGKSKAPSVPGVFSNALEVKMASQLRDLVEDAIKQVPAPTLRAYLVPIF